MLEIKTIFLYGSEMLTDISAHYPGGVIAYLSDIKHKVLVYRSLIRKPLVFQFNLER